MQQYKPFKPATAFCVTFGKRQTRMHPDLVELLISTPVQDDSRPGLLSSHVLITSSLSALTVFMWGCLHLPACVYELENRVIMTKGFSIRTCSYAPVKVLFLFFR